MICCKSEGWVDQFEIVEEGVPAPVKLKVFFIGFIEGQAISDL